MALRILFIHPTFTFGGAERTAFNLLEGLDKEQYKVTLVTSKKISGYFSHLALEKIIYIDDIGIDVWFNQLNTANIKKFWSDVRSIGILIKKESPDITLGMMYYASSLISLAKKLFRLKTKIISSPRGPLTPYINTFILNNKTERLFWKLNFYFSCMYSDGLIVAAEGTKRDCIENFRAEGSKIRVINNGIDVSYVRKMSSEDINIDIPQDFYIISTAGRLAYEKSLSLLFKALALLNISEKVKLLVIGDGPMKGELEILSENLGIKDDVCFLGFQKNPYKYIKASDIFVHTCLLEGFGNVIVEAMSCGVPVIATNCPYGPGEIINNGRSGMLVPMNDEKTLSRAIISLLKDEQRRAEISMQAYQRALFFSVDRMVKSYEKFFSEIARS